MKTTKNLVKASFAIAGLLCLAAFGEPKINTKSGGRCTGLKSCKVCRDCSRCAHCGAGGVCGVCSPESFEVKNKRVIPKKESGTEKSNKDTLKNN